MQLDFISVPYDSGKYNTGMGQGPGCILSTGVANQIRESGHNVNEQTIVYPEEERLTDIQSAFKLNSMLANAVSQTVKRGSFPIILAGNCIASVGALSGLQNKQTAVLWLDAHGDFNTPETTQSGYLDGMALSVVCGHCWKSLAAADPLYSVIPEDRLVLVGARDLDPAEAKALKASLIQVVTADQVRQNNCTIPDMVNLRFNDLYVHFDADVLDASVGCANRFATANGLFPNEIKGLLSWVAENYRIKALAITAYSPEHDNSKIVREVIREILLTVIKVTSSSKDMKKAAT
jgi:arginase